MIGDFRPGITPPSSENTYKVNPATGAEGAKNNSNPDSNAFEDILRRKTAEKQKAADGSTVPNDEKAVQVEETAGAQNKEGTSLFDFRA